MSKTAIKCQMDLLCIIVNFGAASKLIKTAKKCGITGATVFLGMGTADNSLLKVLDLNEVRKEIIIMLAEHNIGKEYLDRLNRKLRLDKPNHGIAFSMPIAQVFGTSLCECVEASERKDNQSMYKTIFIIVDKGQAEEVVEAATAAGARGGTIVNARGSGIHETSRLFSIDIEPEKEIVMILANNEQSEAIIESIRAKLDIEKPGKGIIFVHEVNQTYGLS